MNFFDGQHQVVVSTMCLFMCVKHSWQMLYKLGGSYAIIPRISERRSFRNWYQRNYSYTWVGGRIVYESRYRGAIIFSTPSNQTLAPQFDASIFILSLGFVLYGAMVTKRTTRPVPAPSTALRSQNRQYQWQRRRIQGQKSPASVSLPTLDDQGIIVHKPTPDGGLGYHLVGRVYSDYRG